MSQFLLYFTIAYCYCINVNLILNNNNINNIIEVKWLRVKLGSSEPLLTHSPDQDKGKINQITITFIRHGQSEWNKAKWKGDKFNLGSKHKDSRLSEQGLKD